MLPEEPHNFSTADKGQITKKNQPIFQVTLYLKAQGAVKRRKLLPLIKG